MARIVTKPFSLNLPGADIKQFAVGEKLEGAEAEHWYAKAHSDEISEEAKAETAAEKKAREKAEKEVAKAPEEAKAEPAANQ